MSTVENEIQNIESVDDANDTEKPGYFTYETKYGTVILHAQGYRFVHINGKDLTFPRDTQCSYNGHVRIEPNGELVINYTDGLTRRNHYNHDRTPPKSYSDKFHLVLIDIARQFLKDHPEQLTLARLDWTSNKIDEIAGRIEIMEKEIKRLSVMQELGESLMSEDDANLDLVKKFDDFEVYTFDTYVKRADR